jgi:hypothetical protein
MAFCDVGRNRRSAPLHLRHESKALPWWQEVGETIALDDQFDGLPPDGQVPETLHVKRAHAAPWQEVRSLSAAWYEDFEMIQRQPMTYRLLDGLTAIFLPTCPPALGLCPNP